MKRYSQMRTFRIAAVVALCVFAGVLAGGLACSSSSQDGADQPKEGESARASVDLVEQVNALLQLRSSDVVTLLIDETPGAAGTVNLPIAGEQYTLDLHPHSVRAANYQVKVQLADGSLVDAEPGPVRTLRGTVVGVAGSTVAASMEEDGLHARIFLSDDEQYWVEPVASRVPQAGPNHYVIYNNDDIIAPEKACGLDQLPDALGNRGVLGTVRQIRTGACGTGLCVAELAADADFEYYESYGSSVATVVSRINSVINAVNIQYERDVDITQVLSAIIVRTAEPDPYSFTDATQLIFQFRDHWLANHSNIQRDMAQLFTGKQLNSSTIGIAWLNAVCTSYGFSVVQSDFNNNFGCTTDLTAHELGHNWGADHCNCTSNTMNPYITCSNQFHGTFTIPEIVSFRDSRSCLEGALPCTTNGDCDDLDVCTTDTCVDGSCSNTPLNCNDSVACTADSCDSATGLCINDPIDADCDDGDACTDDTCDQLDGCVTASIICPVGETCLNGFCGLCDGDGVCDANEDCNTCPSDCFSGSGASCGNDICEAGDGEDCVSCPNDCNGVQNGNPNGRFCCGDGGGQNPLDCSDSRCIEGNFECTDVPVIGSCCGNGTCEGIENGSNCAVDCAVACIIDTDCEDTDSCTTDTCSDGVCSNVPIDCTDENLCTVDTCAGGVCENTPLDCDDGDSCNGLETCNSGTGQCVDGPPPGCVSGDGCCGPGCNSGNDSECLDCNPKNDGCSGDGDCCSNKCRGGICRGN
ncbi:MAG: M12 family metallo-peptidase [Planctomycetota bacterium]|nr:M12 family metallo-peptidase [Planctomycetota bacterium]